MLSSTLKNSIGVKRIIPLLIILFLYCAQLFGQQYNKKVVAGFYPYTKDYILKPENIKVNNLTHLIYCFAFPRADGTIGTETGSYHNPSLVSKVHSGGGKFIVMMGGGSQSGGFHDMTASASTRTIFINNLVDWFKTYGYDGVNIDWEYPGDNNKTEDKENLNLLVSEMRAAFDQAGAETGKYYEISMDVHSSLYYAQWVDFATLKNQIDWFGLMSYDYSGNWSYSIHAAHNAPLFCGPDSICSRYLCVDLGVKNLRDELGIPASKIVMGVAFYGREFFNSALYQTPREGGEAKPYYDIKPLIGNGYTKYWDDQSKVPYLLKTGGTGLISYDDEQSLKLKTDYIKQNSLLGAMIWEITQDVDPTTKEEPLLAVIGSNLIGVVNNNKGVPIVAITSPANGYVFTPGSNLTITATAQVDTGTIEKVEFYKDGILLGTDNSAPYNYTWINVPNGKYNIKAIGYSSVGKTGESAVVSISDGIVPEYTEMWDDFNYANSSDAELSRINKWSVVNGIDGPPSQANYSKDKITFFTDPQNSTNKIMGVATTASNDPSKNTHGRIETSVMPYRNGTFAARVYFDDTPAQYGDANVETFYTINSYATCNNPDAYSECDFEYLPWDAWQWERKSTMYYTTWETCEIRTSNNTVKSFAGWHDLVYTAEEGQPVKYYIDGQLMTSHNQYQPDSDVNISFANWIYQNTTGTNTTSRTTTMKVDWVYHAKDVVISPDEVLQKVANLRQNKILRKNLQGEVVVDGNVNPAPTVSITSPANNASFTAPANVTINAAVSDNGTIAKVEFFNGSTKLGEDLSAPYSFNWTNVVAGNYTLTAKATDNEGAIGVSAVVNVSVGTGCTTPPSIAFTSPANGSSYFAPANIAFNVNATAGCSDRTISEVDFYNGTALLGTDNTLPYSFSWTNVPEGNYTIIAKATDSQGSTNTSSLTVSVTNNSTPNLALNKTTVVSSLETPNFPGSAAVDGNSSTRWSSAYSDPQYIYVDLGGIYDVSRVKITWEAAYGRDYQVQLSNDASNWNSIKNITGNTSLVNDHLGLSGNGRYVRIYGTSRGTTYGYSIFELEVYGTSSNNTSPVVSITSPSNNASFNEPATITINANATDANGTVDKVEFFNGSVKLGEDLSSPYSFSWTNVVAGNYSITAKATDNQGAVAVSSAINISVIGSNPTDLEAVYRTISEWGTGFQGEVRIYNHSSSSVTGWTVQFDCPHSITTLWDATIVSHTGTRYIINPTASTQTIAAGQSVVFGFIGNIATGQTYSAPTQLTATSGSSNMRLTIVENSELELKSYPNPTNGAIYLDFTLDNESQVEINIYKNDGSIASRLINKKLPAGANHLVWDVSKFGSGMFFYEIKINNKVFRKKILLKP